MRMNRITQKLDFSVKTSNQHFFIICKPPPALVFSFKLTYRSRCLKHTSQRNLSSPNFRSDLLRVTFEMQPNYTFFLSLTTQCAYIDIIKCKEKAIK